MAGYCYCMVGSMAALLHDRSSVSDDMGLMAWTSCWCA